MAVSTRSSKLKVNDKSANLWRDAFSRLFKNRLAVLGLIIILINLVFAVFAPVIAPFDYKKQVLADNNAAPTWIINMFPVMEAKEFDENDQLVSGYVTVSDKYPLGADALGRDLWSRLIYGARISLAVAFIGPFVSLLIGVSMGLLAGYFRGWVDSLIMRIVDAVYALPTIIVIILLMAFFRSTFNDVDAQGTIRYTLAQFDRSLGGMFFIAVGIGLTSWVGMARLTRGQVLAVRESDYITAAQSLGGKDRNIMWKHVFPNILGPIIVAETLAIPSYIRFEAFLSFIGLGVNPPTPSWGMMIAEGSRSIATYPYQALFPAVALFLMMFAFNFLGDGLRDALDPRMRGND